MKDLDFKGQCKSDCFRADRVSIRARRVALTLFSFAVLLLQGCISFDTGPERSFPNKHETNQLTVQSVTRVVPKVNFVGDYNGGKHCYSLNLVAEGRFVQHSGHSMNKGTPRMAIGLWPGCSGLSVGNKFGWGFMSVVGNYILVGIPTLYSLLVAPFCDYHEQNDNIGEIGLIGVNKYYRDVGRDESKGFVTTSSQSLTRYELFAYAVEIDGVRYEDKDNSGRGCSGTIYFSTARHRGSRIPIRITEEPASRNDGFRAIRGMTISADIP